MTQSPASKFLMIVGFFVVLIVLGVFLFGGGIDSLTNPIKKVTNTISVDKCLRYFDPFVEVAENEYNHVAREICAGDDIEVNPALWQRDDKDDFGVVIYEVQELSEDRAVLKLKAIEEFDFTDEENITSELIYIEDKDQQKELTIDNGLTICTIAPIRDVNTESIVEYCYEYDAVAGVIMNIREVNFGSGEVENVVEDIDDTVEVTESNDSSENLPQIADQPDSEEQETGIITQ